MKILTTVVLILMIVLSSFHVGFTTTIEALDFSTMIEQTAVAFKGQVIDMHVITLGNDIKVTYEKETRSPSIQPLQYVGEDKSSEKDETIDTPLPVPEGVETEGGEMLYTEITFLVQEEIIGNTDSTVTFRLAGGSDGEVSVIVHGLPSFVLNKEYIIFLQSDYETVAAPVVGVNQGFFEVVTDKEKGEEILLNTNGDIVIGVENDHVITRRNPEKGAAHIKPGPPPVPEDGSNIESKMSSEVEQYWFSQKKPMSFDDFVKAVVNVKEGKK